MMKDKMKVTYIVPAYNEKHTLGKVIEKLRLLPVEKSIIVVDDKSTDGSREVLRATKGIRLIEHNRNLGKGAAIRTALEEIKEGFVVIQDADLELEPEETLVLVNEIKNKEKDVVFGTRLKGIHFSLNPIIICNKILTAFTNIIFRARLTDVMTGYKIMHADIIKSLNLKANRFEIETEIAAKLLLGGYNILERPVSYKKRTKKEGKKIRFKDSFGIVWTLIKVRLSATSKSVCIHK